MSFFGFEKEPGDGPEEQDNFSKLDEMLEEKYKFGFDDDLYQLAGSIDNSDSEKGLNDETFGFGASDFGQDFDFTAKGPSKENPVQETYTHQKENQSSSINSTQYYQLNQNTHLPHAIPIHSNSANSHWEDAPPLNTVKYSTPPNADVYQGFMNIYPEDHRFNSMMELQQPQNLMTLEEIEASMRTRHIQQPTFGNAQQQYPQNNIYDPRYHQLHQHQYHQHGPPPNVMSVAELEAKFLAERPTTESIQDITHDRRSQSQHHMTINDAECLTKSLDTHQVIHSFNHQPALSTELLPESFPAIKPISIKIERKSTQAADNSSFPPLNSLEDHADRKHIPIDRQSRQPIAYKEKGKQKQVIYSTNRQYHQQRNEEGNDGHYDQGHRKNYVDQRQRKPRYNGFNGLMTSFDKQLIVKIQVSQLVTDQPLRDDYYYQITKEKALLLKEGNEVEKGKEASKWKQALFGQSNKTNQVPNLVKSLRNQMQKLIEGKKKEKGSSLSLEGALGKISLNSTKNPKQAIAVNMTVSNVEKSRMDLDKKLSSKLVLHMIEQVYDCILDIERLKRVKPADEEEQKELDVEYSASLDKLWQSLRCDAKVSYSSPHPTPSLLLFTKGKRAVGRLMEILNADKTMSFFSVIFNRIECLDVCHIPLGQGNEGVNSFMSMVIPSLIGFISKVPLVVINTYLRILLERHNVQWLTKSKVGLAILTMILSRAEILRQSTATEQELAIWYELYNYLFQSMQGKFVTVFPGAGDRSEKDEVYAWQFLSSMAVGASLVDHQRILVTEVREKAIETAKRNDIKALANVDLFLSALGLDIDATTLASLSTN